MPDLQGFPTYPPVSSNTGAPSPSNDVGAPTDPAAPPALPTLTLKDVYERMREAVNARPLPAYVACTVDDASVSRNRPQRERLRLVVRTSDGATLVRTLRDSGGYDASSDRVELVTTPVLPMTNIYRAGDFPLADFGLRFAPERPGIFDSPGTPEPAANGEPTPPPTLASSRVIDLPYRLRDLGPATIDGGEVVHLGLTPIRDPGHHVLREIWIDPRTFLPLRYVAERFVMGDAAPYHYLVRVETAVVAGRLVNTEAAGHFESHTPTDDLSGDSHWTIDAVGFPENEPDWAFEPGAASYHRGETIPGLDDGGSLR